MKGISQEELAEELGVNESTVFNYENGRHKPAAKILRKLQGLLTSFTEQIKFT